MPSRQGGQRRRSGGFSLLEVIVAFALLALALTLLLGIQAGAARQIGRAGDLSRASLHAQSLLAWLDLDGQRPPSRQQGAFDGGRYHWMLEIAPYRDPAMGEPGPTAAQLRQVSLTVQWGNAPGQALHWRTLRLVQPEAAP